MGDCVGNSSADKTGIPYFQLVISVISCFVATPCSTAVIVAVARDPCNELRNSVMSLVLTAVAGAGILGAIAEPIFIYDAASSISEGVSMEHRIHTELISLQIAVIISFVASMSSVFCLVGITICRYLFASAPDWFVVNATFNRTLFATSMGWLMSISYPFLYLNCGLQYYCTGHVTAVVLTLIAAISFNMLWVKPKLVALKIDGRGETSRREALLDKPYLALLLISLASYAIASVFAYIAQYGNVNCKLQSWFTHVCFGIIRLQCGCSPLIAMVSMKRLKRATKRIVCMCLCPERAILKYSQSRRSSRKKNGAVTLLEMSRRQQGFGRHAVFTM
ncbi:uncharacterized protein LOC116618914 [Nematostella vectensis]|uniref:uncharacterized protein LOC116618914 n=1 Tax=Nematostella vectensis TaxID=45351 RepID=UPI00207700E4|nr:uncharacterized protein LOC116618914 [Nematostella vectensis]